ncbi:tRNAmethyltransferas-like protein [Aulographum hederae CBS 113979]|uniref:tRNA (uracil(54)-C(5))-methyltransferase n=1 Tax=Aulographum hederae CBS 113979 TaxID=1176131 RepID=A0A6G1GJA6_9PEZI|nr:tRNAmethyltransferas-like protein [Aulographum hederae CBS 113979]
MSDRHPENSQRKRAAQDHGRRGNNKKTKKAQKPAKEGSHDEVLLYDVQALLKRLSLANGNPEDVEVERAPGSNGEPPKSLPEPFTEIDLEVQEISSTGDGLAYNSADGHVYVIPFTAPGDTVTAKVIRHVKESSHSVADFVKVVKPSPKRKDHLIGCKYFATCSGCQFQMLSYDDQLAHKKTIMEKAYKNFSSLDPNLAPAIGDTIGSPLQYGYRTKLTPHFDGPPGRRSDGRNGVKRKFETVPPIGFMKKGTRQTLDIEDCPIGTDAVRMGMKRERKRYADQIDQFSRGVTILLRESTNRIQKEGLSESDLPQRKDDTILEHHDTFIDEKTCVTDNNATSTEYVDASIFTNRANDFFQNNNSILPVFTSYIRDHVLPPSSTDLSTDLSTNSEPTYHLVDAYSGSGLFTITLAPLFASSTGIDISAPSIACAAKNAALNNLPSTRAKFMAADASHIFASVKTKADETVVIIDPPRKGCDESFLQQLLEFAPVRVVYVSCNVHTQARDVGVLVNGMTTSAEGKRIEGAYEIESLRGFDFFPQTGHVEGVAVLKRKTTEVGEANGEEESSL